MFAEEPLTVATCVEVCVTWPALHPVIAATVAKATAPSRGTFRGRRDTVATSVTWTNVAEMSAPSDPVRVAVAALYLSLDRRLAVPELVNCRMRWMRQLTN